MPLAELEDFLLVKCKVGRMSFGFEFVAIGVCSLPDWSDLVSWGEAGSSCSPAQLSTIVLGQV